MRRWNGWGDDAIDVPLSATALDGLAALLGPGVISADTSFQAAVLAVPESRLHDPSVVSDAAARLLRARGQSLPDWIARSSGRIGAVPDAVALPETAEQVALLLSLAKQRELVVIPYGGGTSVVGHLSPPEGDRPVLTVSLERLDRLEALDRESRLARFQAGVRGPALEAKLAEHGLQLGHYPQSFEYSTLGGWIATRSSGQQSFGYGRIEDLLAGVQVATLAGELSLPPLPATAAGPDLKQFVLGSEGRLGIVTSAVVRVRALPEYETYHAILFPAWGAGVAALRALSAERSDVTMLRLSDAGETAFSSRLSEPSATLRVANQALARLGYADERCVLILAASGTALGARAAVLGAQAVARRHGGLPIGRGPAEAWRQNRFLSPYLRTSLWNAGYAVDTMETALPWSKLTGAVELLKQSVHDALDRHGERALCFAHVSHVYLDGASIYLTCVFRRSRDPDELLARWHDVKQAVNAGIVKSGGTISHHHGVGVDHRGYLGAEKSEVGLTLLRGSLAALDPGQLLNPGKLLPE
jgi:alkyldihydroxyacetonephosphate synthase